MAAPARITRGSLTDPARPLAFSFDGRSLQGLAGDTLASALLANGARLVGRSFKYHRPRGIVSCGPEEPCALVDVVSELGREPNQLATVLPLQEGLVALSQNRWPALGFDLMAVNNLLARFLPAGFYYKTFMYPAWAWERLYEPLIRRAAGLGRLAAVVTAHATPAETVHAHTDVLVVGAGVAGLSAALQLSRTGLRVILAEQDVTLGAGALLDQRWSGWRGEVISAVAAAPTLRTLLRTSVLGAYGHGVFGAIETLAPEDAARLGGLRERLHVIRARRVVFATGAVERLLAFPGNDTPGVMLAGGALAYLRRYGVAVGRQPVFFVNCDAGYEAAFALTAAGVPCRAIVDVRNESPAAEQARALGIDVRTGAVVTAVHGHHAVRAVSIARADGSHEQRLAADCVLVSGGHSPLTALATQAGARTQWREDLAAFTADLDPAVGTLAGAAQGPFGLAAAAADATRAARAIAQQLGVREWPDAPAAGPVDPPCAPPAAFFEVRAPGKAFVDLQNDVTAADVRLACREGYEHAEHMKRYTTHGMATDQGRIGGLLGSAVLAEARGVPLAQVGITTPRPYAQPVPFAALAGGEVRGHYKPKRLLPLHEWHESAGASFVTSGLWLRPLVYAHAPGWEPVLAEARAVRAGVGITDVSSLGKIDVQGPDAARFLDFVYANTFSTLPIGRARYGIMLREDGMLFDDGTTTRLGPEHFLITTTTANAGAVLEHLEFHLQAHGKPLQVSVSDVGEQWAQFALAGPRARAVLAAALPGTDVSNEALPFMAAAAVSVAGIAARLFRISFSGELAYELAVPARDALAAWTALLQAGAPCGIRPYGLDALNTLRIEKGHVTGAELNGNTSAEDLGFGRMLKKQGDFIGRVLSQRPGLLAADRLQLVGVQPLDPTRRLRNGTQLVRAAEPGVSVGYVTSCTPATESAGWLGLALLCAGRSRIGETLTGSAPALNETTPLRIVSPHMLDPENARVRA